MTVSQLLKALADVDPTKDVVLDLGLDGGFLQPAITVDDEGVRITLDPEDAESAEVANGIKIALA